jgi:hypothetical protein
MRGLFEPVAEVRWLEAAVARLWAEFDRLKREEKTGLSRRAFEYFEVGDTSRPSR